ncbi:MAG TPA: hypothetical protein VI958_11460 [Acidobacteriota bacterium]
MRPLDELRRRFQFLSFLTDKEIIHMLRVVRSASIGTSVSAEEILHQMDQDMTARVAFC